MQRRQAARQPPHLIGELEQQVQRDGGQAPVERARGAHRRGSGPHRAVVGEAERGRVARQRHDRPRLVGVGQRLRGLKALRTARGMQDRPAGRVGELKRAQPPERRAVGAVELHDLDGAEDAPVVQRGLVLERGQQPKRGGVAGRGRVEVELDVGNRCPAVVGLKHVGEVPDAHVVALQREVLAAEAALRGLQVADGRGQLRGGIEAGIDRRALRDELLEVARAGAAGHGVDLIGERLAAGDVDLLAEHRGGPSRRGSASVPPHPRRCRRR